MDTNKVDTELGLGGYTGGDMADLSKLQKMRMKKIEDLDKIDTTNMKSRDLEVFNGLITSQETSIHKLADNRNKQQDAAGTKALVGTVVAMLAEMDSAKVKRIKSNNEYVEQDIPIEILENVSSTIIDGELDINPTPLDKNKFLGGE